MVRFTVLVEIALVALLALFFVTQILIPGCLGRPFFPALRAKRHDALDALQSANEAADVERIKAEIMSVKASAAPASAPVEQKPIKKTRK